MRELTNEELALREQRRAQTAAMIRQRLDLLSDFATRLDLPSPQLIVARPDEYLAAIDTFMAPQVVADEDRIWALTRLSFFVGELFVVRYAGTWFLNELPDSRFFLRAVVGRFARLRNPAAMLDPFLPMADFLEESPTRSLTSWVLRIDRELHEA